MTETPPEGDASADLVSHPVPDAVLEAVGGSGEQSADPTAGWTLRITTPADAGESVPLTHDDLTGLPQETFTGDFSCLEGWTATDLTWRGVRVDRLLEATVGGVDGADHALVRAMDGEYACAFPIDRLTEAVLALELDGDPLPVEHGGPARLVPPGEDADCWRSVKWVASIELTADRPTEADTAREIALSRIDD
ncbi:Oxidoreductase molybdopterin binding domain-containing protein [Halopenitus malekzadehii]|uniref:Oxidoreductase molybdopterin binding domain-containing protein n=1 Tax=Halopenitus malekzadehii TaxID=1267564 RepID=A0A1H6IFR9_9EURY|nr:molybdopterin-dependent oxidoreductase [Halopenitus malekzadehii]SEH46035.1 Oxidoreductase molybdopterin binding domain-containing protein [Halopenitus malekzadehii]